MDKSKVGATDAKDCIKNWSSEASRSSPISALASGEPPKQRGCGDRSLHPQIIEIAHAFQRYDRPRSYQGNVLRYQNARRVYRPSLNSFEGYPAIDKEQHFYNSFLTISVLLYTTMSTEKMHDAIESAQSSDVSIKTGKVDLENDGEVFKRGEGIEDFRTVGWIHTTVILLKREYYHVIPTRKVC